jgi:hypothetical protein
VPVVRVLDRISRQTQRLGYMKRLIKRVSSTPSSNLDNIGNDLVNAVLRKVHTTLNEDRLRYIKIRLFDKAYKTIKDQANSWSAGKTDVEVNMELQDLYLADPSLPSQTGKLVQEDWRRYPFFGMSLGFVREGTFSINTRGQTLLHLVSLDDELEFQAFQEFLPEHNPFRIHKMQQLLFLYSLLENDGEVFIPLLVQLAQAGTEVFSDRDAGSFLPEIYQKVISRHRARLQSVEMRERLIVLEKSAESIAKQRSKKTYEGGGAREEASRPRLEPYVDVGVMTKPDPMKYDYSLSQMGLVWADQVHDISTSDEIADFLQRRFFETAAKDQKIEDAVPVPADKIIPGLQAAWKTISSSNGYAPIEEIALLAGIKALVNENKVIEIATARDALIAYQKANPYAVRFTVDRLGALAHAKFIDDTNR